MTLRSIALTIALAAGAAAQSITLTSPMDYQVFQRQTLMSGQFVVSGQCAVACDRVEARASGGKWTAIPLDAASHRFRGGVPAAAGGFFPVEVRLMRSGAPVAQTVVPRVGIGEVFIIAGQSNATNYGEETQHPNSGMAVTFSGNEWRPADDPQPGVQDNSSKGSFIPALGDALYEKLHVPIAVACVGHGSTSVRQWIPKGDTFRKQPTMTRFVEPAGADGWKSTGQLFDGMMERVRQLGDHGFRALLWHQGESDAHQQSGHEISGEEYRSLMTRLISASRQQAGWAFPWFVAQVSYHTPDDPSTPEIRAAQAALWSAKIALEGPDTDQLTGSNRQNNGKGVHFSAQGLEAHGKLWAEKLAAWIQP